jgi:pimeloyl-ACP methyl ester carboxylesterase
VFRAAVLMSAPFAGPPGFAAGRGFDLDAALAALAPPRRHYTRYYSMPEASDDLLKSPQGLPAFLRGYIHAKSGDFAGNDPHPLGAATPDAYAQLPHYYVMRRDRGMAQTIADMVPALPPAPAWLPDDDLAIYAQEYARTGFQGGLNWYRASGDPGLRLFAARQIDVPTAFIGGARDWGVFQAPGSFEAMATRGCSHFLGATLIPGAGHWVQQEAPEATVAAILAFLGKPKRA